MPQTMNRADRLNVAMADLLARGALGRARNGPGILLAEGGGELQASPVLREGEPRRQRGDSARCEEILRLRKDDDQVGRHFDF